MTLPIETKENLRDLVVESREDQDCEFDQESFEPIAVAAARVLDALQPVFGGALSRGDNTAAGPPEGKRGAAFNSLTRDSPSKREETPWPREASALPAPHEDEDAGSLDASQSGLRHARRMTGKPGIPTLIETRSERHRPQGRLMAPRLPIQLDLFGNSAGDCTQSGSPAGRSPRPRVIGRATGAGSWKGSEAHGRTPLWERPAALTIGDANQPMGNGKWTRIC